MEPEVNQSLAGPYGLPMLGIYSAVPPPPASFQHPSYASEYAAHLYQPAQPRYRVPIWRGDGGDCGAVGGRCGGRRSG